MDELISQAEDWIKVGQRSDHRRGLFHLAMVRYAQAFATLINIVTLRDTGTIALSKSQEQKVSMLYQALSARTASMSFRTSNGHKMAGKVECKDTLTDAIAVLLEEMAAFS